MSQILRGFAAVVIGVTAAYFVYALTVTVADDTLAAGERAAVAVALGLGFVVCLLMLALRLDDSLFDGGLAVRGLKGKLYVALMVCALLMLLVALLGGTARLGAIAVIIFPAAVAFGLLGTMSEMESS